MHSWMTLLLGVTLIFPIHTQNYTLYHTGNIQDTITSPLGGICMMGGRRENDEAMKWFLNRADGGDIVVLRASGSDGYNDYFYSQLDLHINSVTSIVFHNREASYHDTILQIVSNAEAIWMAGGNQWNYVQFWRNSPIDSIINYNLRNKKIAIGGTSAGMAILGGIYFTASNGTVSSEESLVDPLMEKITIDTTLFLDVPILDNVITDTHYDERNRQGRHAVFMARALNDYQVKTYGIACDEYTSLCIDNYGIGRAYGNYPEKDDQVYFLSLFNEPHQQMDLNFKMNNPFTWSNSQPALNVYKLPGTNDGSYSFDLNNWQAGIGGSWYEWRIVEGQVIFIRK